MHDERETLAPDAPTWIDDEHSYKQLSPSQTFELLHYARINGVAQSAIAELLFYDDLLKQELPQGEYDGFILRFVVRCLRASSSVGGTGRKELVQALISKSQGDPWLAEEGLRMIYADEGDSPKRFLSRLRDRGITRGPR